MEEAFTCPVLIQPAPYGSRCAPLFLVHDGSGTIFCYHLLKLLGRAVYGIGNPRFYDERGWIGGGGGIKEMAAEYLEMIQIVQPSGEILLGGWSLGGIVSFEIAYQIFQIPASALRVTGLLLIDSVWPHSSAAARMNSVTHFLELPPHVHAAMALAISRCMSESKELVTNWEPQTWQKVLPASSRAGSLSSVSALDMLPPPAILLRARDRVPIPGPNSVKFCDIDIYRDEPMLGWEGCGTEFIRKVLPIKGNHYDVFEYQNIKSLYTMLHLACRILDVEHLNNPTTAPRP